MKGKKKKMWIIFAATAVVLGASQLVVLGLLGGIGPLAFLHDRKIAAHPGNAPQYALQNVAADPNSPLSGKNILFLGSSVTQGHTSFGVSMADYMAAKDGCRVIKEAVGGTTLADNGSNSFFSRLKTVDPEQRFDVIVIQLSTNDASKNMPLGSISSSDSYDTSTTLGAMEAIFSYCNAHWDCPILVYTGTKYDSSHYAEMVAQLPVLQEKWSIAVLDLWNDPEMNAVSKEDYALYMFDNVHPTQAGYLNWWLPKFEDAITALN